MSNQAQADDHKASLTDTERTGDASPPATDNGDTEKAVVEPSKPAGPPPGMRPQDFPDGGAKAWLAVLGAWCCLFCSFGWVSSIGVFQAYYEANQLQGYSTSSISWILSVEVFVLQVLAPVYGKIFDSYGPRGLLAFGTFFHVFGLMMLSISDKYYQIFLSQSICSSIGASALFYAANNAATTWFFKKRALALGVAVSGSSLGGLILPIMFNRLTATGTSFGWTIRGIAFLMLGLLVIANVVTTSRLNHSPKPFKVMDFIRPLGEMKFLFTVLGCYFVFWGLFLPTNYIIVYAEYHGMSVTLAGYQLAILNAVSIFGRILPGWAADVFGRFNLMIVTIVLNVIFVLALWIPAQSNAPIIVFSAVYGFTSGAFVSLIPAVVAQISDIRQIGVRVGTTFFVVSIAALTGNPIGGALIQQDNGNFLYAQIFAGVSMFVGIVFFTAARYVQCGMTITKKI